MATQSRTDFKTWLLQQKDRQDSVGEFARMAAADTNFPNETTEVRQQLRRHGASDETMARCGEAIREYNQTS